MSYSYMNSVYDLAIDIYHWLKSKKLMFHLTHLSLDFFLWDIGKQHSPRCDAAERGVPFGAILFA